MVDAAVVVAYDRAGARRGGSRGCRRAGRPAARTGAPRRAARGLATTASRRPRRTTARCCPSARRRAISLTAAGTSRWGATAPAAVGSHVLQLGEQVDGQPLAAHPDGGVGHHHRSGTTDGVGEAPGQEARHRPGVAVQHPGRRRGPAGSRDRARWRVPRPENPTAGWPSPRASTGAARRRGRRPGTRRSGRGRSTVLHTWPAGAIAPASCARLLGERRRRSGARSSPCACGRSGR